MKTFINLNNLNIDSVNLPDGVGKKKCIIVEISGKDSLAAIVKYSKDKKPKYIIPTYSFTGTEYGDFKTIEDNVSFITQTCRAKYNINVGELVVLGNPKLWWLINGRYISLLFEKYKFYTPCIGCHLYFHLVRLPLANKLGVKKIISGERKRHDKKVKLNQMEEVLEAFQKIFSKLGFELIMPLKNISNNLEISKLVQLETDWKNRQLRCTLSSNYLSLDGKVIHDREKLKDFLNSYIFPAGISIGKNLIAGETFSEDMMIKLIEKL